jgi:hypothetical protein
LVWFTFNGAHRENSAGQPLKNNFWVTRRQISSGESTFSGADKQQGSVGERDYKCKYRHSSHKFINIHK